MRILQYGNRKMEPIAWDASTPELEAAAFLELFRYFNGDYWQMYVASPPTPKQKRLYERAKGGDAGAARKLLEMRKDYEYEDWKLVEVQDYGVNGWTTGKVDDMFRQRDLELKA
jgi:hypothetical protein